MADLESQISNLEQTLNGAESSKNDSPTATSIEGGSKNASSLTSIKTAISKMNNEDKKELTAMFMEDKKSKNAADLEKKKEESDKEKQMKSANDDLKKKVSSLTASINQLTNQPTVEKMLTARANAGMTQEEIAKFKDSLNNQSIEQVNQRYEEDKMLFANNSKFNNFKNNDASLSSSIEIPFNGDLLEASGETKTLEELFD